MAELLHREAMTEYLDEDFVRHAISILDELWVNGHVETRERHMMRAQFDALLYLPAIMRAADKLTTLSDGSRLGSGYQRGGGNVVMVVEASVNNVRDLVDAIDNYHDFLRGQEP